ncbi:butyrophilin subfamily 2 member A2-like [Trachinotus anak]|uniref:butyrophilin subfamily 2 member A2-like n=1 Tax=Trachinotus anak TaxID=443729 RepID=UPI0039F177A5
MDSADINFHLSVVFVLLLQSFRVFLSVQSELVCSHQPIVALAGDDVILPCHLEPAINATRVEWTKPGVHPKYVQIHDKRLLHWIQNPSYDFRTRLFVDELEQGNVSMKIFRVRLSDEGKYRCFIPSVQEEAFVRLSVGSVSSPVIEVTSITSRRVVLQCESKGWYPEPEVLWLDGEGKLLPAGPTETVRGPDGLYTVSSRVTVEKRHSNSFTCRVQQKDINQTRETHIQVPDDFFLIQSTSSSPASIFGWVVGIIITLTAALVVLIWRQSMSIISNIIILQLYTHNIC